MTGDGCQDIGAVRLPDPDAGHGAGDGFGGSDFGSVPPARGANPPDFVPDNVYDSSPPEPEPVFGTLGPAAPVSVLHDGTPAPACEACRGFEPHNSGQCTRTAAHDVSGVKLCPYHNAVRAYVPVLYLADGRGMNHAGVVGTPPERTEQDAGVGTVDALVALADRMNAHTNATPDGPTAPTMPEPGSIAEAFEREIAAIVGEFPDVFESSIPPSEAEPEPRPCVPPRREPVPVPPFMSTDSATRKGMPVASGFLAYFPDAVMLASIVSLVGANKHCGGVLKWDKSKSADEPDAEARHMLDMLRGLPPDPGLEALAHLGHYASKLWRAAADCQRAADVARAAFERGEDWRK